MISTHQLSCNEIGPFSHDPKMHLKCFTWCLVKIRTKCVSTCYLHVRKRKKNGLSCEWIGVIKAGMDQLEAAICFDDIAWSEALLKGASYIM